MKQNIIGFLAIALLVQLWSCQTNEASNEPPTLVQSVDTSLQEELKSNPVLKPTTLVKQRAQLPVLLIQNCGVLLPISCNLSEGIDVPGAKKWVNDFFSSDTLVALSATGLMPLSLDSIYCMRGECGGSQIAFHLPENLCFGLVMSQKDYQQKGPFHFLAKINDKGELIQQMQSELQRDSLNTALKNEMKRVQRVPSLSDCSHQFYSDSAHHFIVQRSLFNYDKKLNDTVEHPPIQEMIFEVQRSLIWQDSLWIVRPWEVLESEWGSWLAETLVYAAKSDTLLTVQYDTEGICCPSLSTLRVTAAKISADSSLVLWEETFEAGLGQPCD